jgi:hypothetical protein
MSQKAINQETFSCSRALKIGLFEQLLEQPPERGCIQNWCPHLLFGRNLAAQHIPHKFGREMMLVDFMMPIHPLLQK